VDHFDVLAGGDLGEHATILGVHIRLRGHYVGERQAAIFHDGRGSLVARGFDTQNAGGAKLFAGRDLNYCMPCARLAQRWSFAKQTPIDLEATTDPATFSPNRISRTCPYSWL